MQATQSDVASTFIIELSNYFIDLVTCIDRRRPDSASRCVQRGYEGTDHQIWNCGLVFRILDRYSLANGCGELPTSVRINSVRSIDGDRLARCSFERFHVRHADRFRKTHGTCRLIHDQYQQLA
jgi:hypothetical protein